MPRYGRVVVKLSGEALAGAAGSGVDPASLAQVPQPLYATAVGRARAYDEYLGPLKAAPSTSAST